MKPSNRSSAYASDDCSSEPSLRSMGSSSSGTLKERHDVKALADRQRRAPNSGRSWLHVLGKRTYLRLGIRIDVGGDNEEKPDNGS